MNELSQFELNQMLWQTGKLELPLRLGANCKFAGSFSKNVVHKNRILLLHVFVNH